MLKQKDKDMMAEMYQNKDMYDPSMDPEQEPHDFIPKGMSEGGYCMAHGGYCMAEGGKVMGPKKVGKVMHEFGSGKIKSSSGDKVTDRDQAIAIAMSEAGMSNKATGGPVGYDEGGTVSPDSMPLFDFSTPQQSDDFSVSNSTDTQKENGNIDLPSYIKESVPAEPAPEEAADNIAPEKSAQTPIIPTSVGESEEEEAPAASTPPAQVPAVPPQSQKLSPDQLDALIASFKPTTGQRVAQGASSVLSTLGDSIMQGVARAGPGQSQKTLAEIQQNKQQNLINALKTKYDAQFRNQEQLQAQERIGQEAARIAEEARSHKATETETHKARELTERQQNLADKRAAQQLSFEQRKEARTAAAETQKQNVEAAQKVVEAYQKGAGFFGGKIGQERPSDAEYNKALNVIKSTGTAAGLGPKAPPAPGSVVKHENGNFKFLGGNPSDPKSWQKI